MGNFNYYAIRRAKDENNQTVENLIFDNWYEASNYIKNDKKFARYKGFLTEIEAQSWLDNVDEIDKKKRSNNALEARAKNILDESKGKDGKSRKNAVYKALTLSLKEFVKQEHIVGTNRFNLQGTLAYICNQVVSEVYDGEDESDIEP